LAESAFIAGVTHSPNMYNPYSEKPNTEIIKSRPKTVLNEMKKADMITNEHIKATYSTKCGWMINVVKGRGGEERGEGRNRVLQ